MRLHIFAIGLISAALSVAASARGQAAPAAGAVTSPALPLTLEIGSSQLDAEAVRKAIELELERPVVLATGAVEAPHLSVIARANGTVTVSYRTSTGSTRSRSIGIPEDRARGAEVIALLSGNLSRDEAAELLASLTAKSAPTPEAAVSPDGVEPAPEETVPQSETPREPSAGELRSPPLPKRAQPSDRAPLIETPRPAINLSLVAPLSLYRSSERRIFSVELGLGYSHVGELHGAGLNVFVLRTEQDVRGASFATFYNDTGGTVKGVAGSALVNRRQRLHGLEVSGLLNLGESDARGFAVAGLANLDHDFEGFQAAGLVNWADRFQGLQVAGVVNRSRAFSGVQAAGGVNIAESVAGLQLGVVNVAGKVHGLQLGVVNVAKKVKGTSIGLVSVADNGGVEAVLWASTSQLINAAAKFTVGWLYTQAGLGYAPSTQTYGYELGLGGHFTSGRLCWEPGVHYSEVRSAHNPFDHALIEYLHYRMAASVTIGQVAPFLGVGILQRFAHSVDAPTSTAVAAELFAGSAFFWPHARKY